VRLLSGTRHDRALTLVEHLAVHGPLRARGPELVDLVEAAGLTGRGGGAFPLARKMRTAAGGRRTPVVVVNAAESEPASEKDAWLAARAPHLVVDGAVAVAASIGARDVVLWVHRGASSAVAALTGAVAERRHLARREPAVRIAEGPDRYVAGEASAIVRHLSGGPALPTVSRHRTAERGVDGRPTVLANAETFAHVALIARHGPDWFRSTGTPEEPGTLLLTLRGAVRRPGVVEAAPGTPLPEVLDLAGGPAAPLSALLVGGYGGSWLSWADAATAALTRAGLAALHADLGVGLLLAFPAGRCPLAETERITGWLAAESTGQCGPCVNGLPALASDVTALVRGDDPARLPDLLARLHRRADLVTGRGACHHPDGTARLVRSALRVFADHVDDHARSGRCPDLVASPVAPLPAHSPVAPAGSWR
jgi:NADH:ubiquinone oxidoreductase subunit F (NADH-binding)